MTAGKTSKFSSMTGSERVLTALKRQKPDRVPHFEWSIHEKVIAGILPGASYESFIEETVNDAIWVSPSYSRTPIHGTAFVDEWGVTRQVDPVEGYPTALKGPIARTDDLRDYRVPDPEGQGRLDSLRNAVRTFKGRKAIGIRLRDVLSLPRDLLGYEEFLIAMATDPDLVGRIAEMSLMHTSQLARLASRMGAEVVMFGDDYCDVNGPLMGPRLFEEVLFPVFRRLVANVKSEGLIVIKHTDGNVMPIVELLIESGIDCLDPIDPQAGLVLGEMKKKYGHAVALKGNVPCAGVLQFGTAEDVTVAVRECIEAAGEGGGYICSSSNSIHSGVPPENYRALMDEIVASGKYL